MRIMMVAAEASPYAKVGGLGDVAGALPVALAELGHDIRLVMPRAQGVMPHRGARVAWRDRVRWGTGDVDVCLLAEPFPHHPKVQTRLVDAAPLTGSPLYGGPDEADRYMLLADAALADLHHDRWIPDVVHAQDWHASPVILRLAQLRDDDPVYAHVRTVLTVHNMAYQGTREAGFAPWHGLPSVPAPGDPDIFSVNLLGRALASADRVTAVSPTFAWEITTPEGGFGLDGVLRARASVVSGILNGVDYREWSPETDRYIPAHYSAEDLDGKAACKHHLLAEFGLPQEGNAPVIGIISRFVNQKGFDLIAEIAQDIVNEDIKLVALGTGEPQYENLFRELAAAHPDKVGARIAYDNRLAHLIEAGSDIFLMPSMYEPCGLNQIYSLRYGAVPVVRATGGLDDTIDETTGFKFRTYSGEALRDTLRAALEGWANRTEWVERMRRGMRKDYSWNASAAEYSRLYRQLAG